MKIIKEITEDEVIHLFLCAETESSRFKSRLESVFKEFGVTEKMIESPDFNDKDENDKRRQALLEYRGFGFEGEMFKDKPNFFKGFPKEIKWAEALITKEEFRKVHYINDPYWIELSRGSRLGKDAAVHIREGKGMTDLSNEAFNKVAKRVKDGEQFPKLILVSKDSESRLVVLEGHLRTTAFMLSHDHLPQEFPVIIGFSPLMDKWAYY